MRCRRVAYHQRRKSSSVYRIAIFHQHFEGGTCGPCMGTGCAKESVLHARSFCTCPNTDELVNAESRMQPGVNMHGPSPHAAPGAPWAKKTASEGSVQHVMVQH